MTNPNRVNTPESTFDQYLETYQSQANDARKDATKVDMLLRAAGVALDQSARITSDPSLVDQILRRPQLAQAYAQRFPSTGMQNTYETFATQLGFTGEAEATFGYSGGADALAMNALKQGPVTSDAGGVKFPNGVLVNPTTGEVVFPNDAEVQGSPAWLMKVSNWSDDKIKTWRETLAKAGYIESSKGGATVDFIEALRTYHTNRYLYGNGRPVDLSDSDSRVTRDDFGAVLDDDVLKGEVRGWFQEVFGDDPSRQELIYWKDKLKHTALKVARKKGYEPGDAATVAQTRTQQQFLDSPSAETAIEDEYESTVLKDELTNAAAASDFLAFGR